jgi:hypothetical protein
MKILLSLAAGALVVAACATGRRDPELMSAYRATQSPSIYGLLGAREELKLTSAQVTALDSIAEELRTANRRLADQMRDVTDARPGGPIVEPRDSAERARFIPLLREVAENNQRAVAAVRTELTEEQRTAACRIADDRAGRGLDAEFSGRSGHPRHAPQRRGLVVDPEAMPDSVMPGVGRVWPWCRPAAPARS